MLSGGVPAVAERCAVSVAELLCCCELREDSVEIGRGRAIRRKTQIEVAQASPIEAFRDQDVANHVHPGLRVGGAGRVVQELDEYFLDPISAAGTKVADESLVQIDAVIIDPDREVAFDLGTRDSTGWPIEGNPFGRLRGSG